MSSNKIRHCYVTAFSSVVGYRRFGETCCHASHLRKPCHRRETGGPLEMSRCTVAIVCTGRHTICCLQSCGWLAMH